MSIILIIVAFVVGAIISYLLFARGKQHTAEQTGEDMAVSKEADSTYREQLHSMQEKYDKQRIKYEALIEEAQQQCAKLDERLRLSTEGKLDESIKKQLAEVEKLKKKIKDLEEDLDDAEDDADSLKRKLKNKEADYNSLQDNFDITTKEANSLREQLEQRQHELDEKVAELSLKISSLDFVQEILSAKEASSDDIKKLYANIAAVQNFAGDTFVDICKEFEEKYVDFNKLNDAYGQSLKDSRNAFADFKQSWQKRFDEWKAVKSKNWLHNKTTIAFVGEFSAGKTSIVNRILSQDNPNVPLLPVSAKATTAIPTYIAGDVRTTYKFVTPDEKQKIISDKTFKKVDKDILDQIKGVSSLIKYFVIGYNNPNLDGLSVLDTPGFNSNDSEDKERTLEVINECDALFWAFDVNAGTINRSSISLIKEYLRKPLYVVINKVDTKSSSEVKKVENLIRKTLADNGVKVEQFIRFSQKAPLNDIMSVIKAVKRTTEKDNYLGDLEEQLNLFSSFTNEICQEQYAVYKETEKKYDELINNFYDELKEMGYDCEEAKQIPHWETHFFGSDRFEMNEEEGARLHELLDVDIPESFKSLNETYYNTTEIVQEWQAAWQNYSELKSLGETLNSIMTKWKKIRNNVK